MWNSVTHIKLRIQTAGVRDKDTEGISVTSARGSGRRLHKSAPSESTQIVLLSQTACLEIDETCGACDVSGLDEEWGQTVCGTAWRMGHLARSGTGCQESVQVGLVTSTELMWQGVGFGVVVNTNTEMNLSGHPLPTWTNVIYRRLSAVRTKLN